MCSSNSICNCFALDVDVVYRLEYSCLYTNEFLFKISSIVKIYIDKITYFVVLL